MQVVKQLKICFNCLRPHHSVKDCISGGCKKCGSQHNTLLHAEPLEKSSKDNPPSVLSAVTASQCSNNSEVLLSTAIVYVTDNKGIHHSARALLDSGSQSNFLSEDFFKKLEVSSQEINQPVKGLNQISTNIKETVKLEIRSPTSSYLTKTNFLVISKITDNLPQRSFNIASLNIPDNIILADLTFSAPGKIDMLIGAPLFWELLCIGQLKIGNTRLIMQKTKLGWIISGSIPCKQELKPKNSVACNFLTLDERLEKFWALDEINVPLVSQESKEFEKNFQQTVRRRNDGRFEVALPLNSKVEQIGDSFEIARRRSHDEISATEAEPSSVYYLPHHGIYKENSTTTKLRVVFDGSAKTDTGISLNDVLISGSQLQNDLFSILLRLRKHSNVITSDVEKMYRQVYIAPQHRDLQRILWGKNSTEQISKYRLNTVTYGTKCGSFLAIRCLQEVANQLQQEFPIISRVISQDFYVDDLLTGGETVTEVLLLRQLLTEKLAQFGFNLRKWNSNHKSVVQEIQQTKSELKHLIIEDNISKTLGLWWDAHEDTIQYSVEGSFKQGCTKRAVISAVAQIFDPLGLIGPVTTIAKGLMQDIRRHKLNWDESLPQGLLERWREFQHNWEGLRHIEISRHVLVTKATTVQLHGFCDASESAYGACIYVSSTNKLGEQKVELLCS